jgi:hypothetical protein
MLSALWSGAWAWEGVLGHLTQALPTLLFFHDLTESLFLPGADVGTSMGKLSSWGGEAHLSDHRVLVKKDVGLSN